MKIKNFLENFILLAIVLVIVQTFVQELSVYLHWNVEIRLILMFSGLFFDFLFTTEFIVRSIASIGKKKGLFKYWFKERGWVDFLSSLPLLILDSGPSTYLYITGSNPDADSAIGVLNVLKVVKAIRVTRILRLVRIIKIFGKIHNADSKMAQHHTTTISTTAVFTVVCTLIIFSVFFDGSGNGKMKNRRSIYTEHINTVKEKYSRKKSEDLVLKNILGRDKNILKIISGNKTLISNVTDEKMKKYYNNDDFSILKVNNITLYYSVMDIHREVALDHMKSFFIIVLLVLSFMIIYTKHFAQNISDVAHILNKGFRKKNYNLQIKIKENMADDEIFRLARFYNDSYLPAKLRRIQDQEEDMDSGLSMDDLMNFKK